MENVNTSTSKAAWFAFLLLFPGFFFYHSALGLQIIPPFLGGYFTPVSLVLTPVLLTLYIARLHKSKGLFTSIDFAFFAFISYFILVVSVNEVFFDAHEEIVRMHLISIIHLVVVFIIFKFSDFSAKAVFWTALLCWIGMTSIIFLLSSDGFFYLRQQEATTNQDYVATYQGFGRSYFLTFLVLVPFIRRMPCRLILYVFSVAALFVNGARSEFVAAIVAVAVLEIINAKSKLLSIFLASSMGLIIALYGADFINLLPENRTLQLMNLSECSSCDERNVTEAYAFEVIKKYPLLGDFGNYLLDIENQKPGSYAHNILSAWVDLGFLGFTWLLLLFLLPLYGLTVEIFSLKSKEHFSDLLLTFCLLIVTLLLLLIAKQFTYMLIGAALGQYANYQYKKRSRERYSPPAFGVQPRRMSRSTRVGMAYRHNVSMFGGRDPSWPVK